MPPPPLLLLGDFFLLGKTVVCEDLTEMGDLGLDDLEVSKAMKELWSGL